ncbi:hypothetical protein QTI33_26555 [Variovorax sp. J22P271]|uniref:hypothetical protein n=1 Tax=Variovorax davisae TaxID=3053515 RepID=UPI0025769A29|nr:hypothetical protein [Variovorax sp. J22P271]MDM0035721.1 hypothetical protein [Variovorax sp. J22P271]
MEETQYDTNLGWWTDKPAREGRAHSQQWVSLRREQPTDGFGVWRTSALIVTLVTVLTWILKFAVL